MGIIGSITETIGSAPLLRLERYERLMGLDCELLAKLEYFNPSGSIKDKAAFGMILDAEARGKINKDSVIIEPTSGNTGIGLAMVCAVRGYRLILTMPESMSVERRKLLQAYGAELVLTPAAMGMQGAVDRAGQLAGELSNAFIPDQFSNPANARAHVESTGPEIWRDCERVLDCFVCGVGTGGTITGAGQFLKKQDSGIKVVAVEPESSPLLSGGQAGRHGIQGIGANFVPDVLDMDIIDEIITVSDQDAFMAVRRLARCEGVFAGISSGAALHAAALVAQRGEHKRVAVVLPDSGERYMSVEGMFEQ